MPLAQCRPLAPLSSHRGCKIIRAMWVESDDARHQITETLNAIGPRNGLEFLVGALALRERLVEAAGGD
jgi:hypothetical protein